MGVGHEKLDVSGTKPFKGDPDFDSDFDSEEETPNLHGSWRVQLKPV